MKKLTIGLAVLFFGMAANSFAADAEGTSQDQTGVDAKSSTRVAKTSPFSVCIPSLCGGFRVGVTGYMWRAVLPHLDYALVYPASTPPVTPDPFGPFDVVFADGRHRRVDHEHRGGFRIHVGYIFPCTGNDFTLAYTYWDHNERDHVDRNRIIIPTLTADTLGGVILFPSDEFVFDELGLGIDIPLASIFGFFEGVTAGIGGVPVDRASAKTDVKYNAWDLEFGQYVNMGCNIRMHWFGGVRWADIDHRFNVTYSGSLINVNVTAAVADIVDVDAATLNMAANIVIRDKSEFDGIGPRFGLNARYDFARTGFGMVGEASTALLVGEVNSNFRERHHFAAVLTVDPLIGPTVSQPIILDTSETFYHPDEKRIVPNLEGKIGIDYTYVFENCAKTRFTFELGYFVTHYFNSDDLLSDVGGDAPEFRTRHTLDTSFKGPYLGLQLLT